MLSFESMSGVANRNRLRHVPGFVSAESRTDLLALGLVSRAISGIVRVLSGASRAPAAVQDEQINGRPQISSIAAGPEHLSVLYVSLDLPSDCQGVGNGANGGVEYVLFRQVYVARVFDLGGMRV